MPSALLALQIQAIKVIDRKIDGIRKELIRRVGAFNTLSADSWQLAWNRNPDLDARHNALFRFRGVAQQTRDLIIECEYQAELRRLRALRRRASQGE